MVTLVLIRLAVLVVVLVVGWLWVVRLTLWLSLCWLGWLLVGRLFGLAVCVYWFTGCMVDCAFFALVIGIVDLVNSVVYSIIMVV